MALTQNSYTEGSVGSTLANPSKESDLDRGFSAATHLHELLNELDARLSPVLNRMPSEATQGQSDSSPHIGILVEAISQAANKVRVLIDTLAI